MANDKIITSKFFDTKDTDLSGNIKEGKNISSSNFIYSSGKELAVAKDTDQFGRMLFDYSITLKELVKQEMLTEMRKQVENLDTFYR